MCKLRIGPHEMHFTGYQPERTDTKEFCEDIPSVGQTVVVLDFVDYELRELPVEVRIVSGSSNGGNLESGTVLLLPAQTYPTGTIHFDHNFPDAGKYVGLVTVTSKGQRYVSRFPFAVGEPFTNSRSFLPSVAAVTACAIGAGYLLVASRRRSKTPDKSRKSGSV